MRNRNIIVFTIGFAHIYAVFPAMIGTVLGYGMWSSIGMILDYAIFTDSISQIGLSVLVGIIYLIIHLVYDKRTEHWYSTMFVHTLLE